MNKIKRLIILFMISLSIGGYEEVIAKGQSGSYKAIITFNNPDTLGNRIEISYNDSIYVSNENGEVLIEVKWSTDCPYGLNIFQRRKYIKEKNEKYITIIINNKSFMIKNKWRKYGLKQELKTIKKVYLIDLP